MPFDNLPEPTPSREVQLLRLAQNSIGSRQQWVQNKWMGPKGEKCMVMAVQDACSSMERTERRRMVRRLVRLLDHETPLRRRLILCWLSSRQRLIIYNDSRMTTHKDVMAVFHRTIERTEWREASESIAARLYPG